MSPRRAGVGPRGRVAALAGALLVSTALLAAVLLAPAGGAAAGAKECNGIQRCVSVPGPWVAVPARGAAEYLLVCPGGKGIVGGTDALVSSQSIAVSFDGIPGSPVAYGRTTNYEVLFRAFSASTRPGLFEPFIGCIPTQSSERNTTGVTPALPLGSPADLKATSISPTPGATDAESLACPAGQRLLESWTATGFMTTRPPAPALAEAITAPAATRRGVVSATVTAAASLPASAHALVQLGVGCTAP